MTDRILFQRDRLTVMESHLTVGRATIFFPNISSLSIYDGRPLLGSAIVCVVGVLPMGFLAFMGARLLGPYFSVKAVAWPLVPMVIFVVAGITYRVKCLFVSVDGSAIAVLRSRDLAVLEEAKRVIEDAKNAFGKASR